MKTGLIKTLKKHSPEILTGIGVASILGTAYTFTKGTIKAVRIVDAYKEENGIPEDEKLPAKELVKLTWKCYIPGAITAGAGIASVVGAAKVHGKRTAIATAACKATELAFDEYKHKVVETIGEKKEQSIKDSIADDKMEKNPASSAVIITGGGDTLCYDVRNDRYFMSTYDKIKRAENNVNRTLNMGDYISLNEVYDELDLKHTQEGSTLGWRSIDLMPSGLEIEIGTHLTDDGRPCLAIEFSENPKIDFDMYC